MALELTIRVDKPTPARLVVGVHALVALNRMDFRALRERGRTMPRLYESGVRYEKEPWPREVWQTALQVLAQGYGDCEDLVGWRVAELLEQSKVARPKIVRASRDYWHVVVEHGSGAIEDPSKRLGMKWDG